MKDPFFILTLILSLVAIIAGIINITNTTDNTEVFTIINDNTLYINNGATVAVLVTEKLWLCNDGPTQRRMTTDPKTCIIKSGNF